MLDNEERIYCYFLSSHHMAHPFCKKDTFCLTFERLSMGAKGSEI